MPTQIIPFVVTGTVYASDGTTTVDNIGIKVTNLNSGESFTSNTNNEGAYVIDLGNFATGWANNETVKIETDYNDLFANTDFEYYASHDAGKTWHLVDHNTTYTMVANKTRTKIDIGNYPGGRSNVNITGSAA